MRLYAGKNKKKAKETTIGHVLMYLLGEAGLKAEMNKFNDGSGGWVEINQITKDGKAKVSINIGLTDDYKEITDVGVWVSKMIFDEENAKKII